MSEIIESVQKQDPGSELITLFDLEYAPGTFAYFTSNYNSSSIQFRDTSGNIRTYTPLAIEADGFDVSSDGSYSRPTLTVANVSSLFLDTIGDLEDLVGKRITRRLTLKKFLVGESGDSTPPVEYPKTTYVIDRIKERNIIQITFELAAPFDLAGVTLPRRQIIGGGCPWRYQAASATLAENLKRGGCTWNEYSNYKDGTVYVNQKDEYVVSENAITGDFTGSATTGEYYRTLVTGATFQRIDNNGAFQPLPPLYNYWQCLTTTTTSPSATASEWRQVRTYRTYSASETYNAFTNADYNDYVLYTTSGEPYPRLWRVKTITMQAGVHPTTPQLNIYWGRGDICGKRVNSCSLRFHANPGTYGPTTNTSKEVALPFGGFPGARAFS